MASTERAPAPTTRPHPAYSALVGLTSLGVLLQGLWAGLFLRPGDQGTWVSIHQHAGETTVLLGVLAAVAALVWMRHNRPALIGTLLLAVLLVVELVLGYSLDGGSTGAVVVHVPLAMLLMGLAVYLPLAARRTR
ncbi:hypothetical protein [Modestobacter sp. NPDC049651]|uniref:hypothetical protein n=1 Tax=unclassified Modestobacter TaxID=2643866 RepID=UPI003401C558